MTNKFTRSINNWN